MFTNSKPPSFGSNRNNKAFGYCGTPNVSNANPFSRPSPTGFNNLSAAAFGQPPSMFRSQQNAFGQPATQQSTYGSIFGTPTGQTTGSLFGSTTFGQQNRTTGFNFQPSSNNLSMFGQNTAIQQQPPLNIFGQSTGYPFGGAPFSGTILTFEPTIGTDTIVKGNMHRPINTRHQCITTMQERSYNSKSFEELRWEDYQDNRKGPQLASSRIFSGTNSVTPYSTPENKLFGSAPSAFVQSNPFGATQTSTSANIFGKQLGYGATTTTSNFPYPSTPTNLFTNQNNKPFMQPTNLFAQAATGFVSQPAFNPFSQQSNNQNTTSNIQNTSLFSAKPTTPFVNTSYSQPSNITPQSGFFNGFKPNLTYGGYGITNTVNQSTIGTSIGQTQTVFNTPYNKPIGNFLGQTNQLSPVGTGTNFLGTQKPVFNFTSGIFNTSGLQQQQQHQQLQQQQQQQQPFMFTGAIPQQQQSISLMPQAQNTLVDNEPRILALSATPYGLSTCLKKGIEEKLNANIEEMKRPTNQNEINQLLASVKKPVHEEILETSQKSVPQRFGRKMTLFDGLEERESYKYVTSKPNRRKLILRHKGSYKISAECNESIMPSTIKPQETSSLSYKEDSLKTFNKSDDKYRPDLTNNTELSASSSNISLKTLYCPPNKTPSSESILETNKHASSNKFDQDSISEKFEDAQQYLEDDEINLMQKNSKIFENTNIDWEEPHPTGIILKRPEYYTKPTLDELTQYISEDGSCIVEGFTVGRIGYGNVRFTEAFDVSNLNLDELVFFLEKQINVYPDDTKKPPVGQGLNRKALVTLDRVWPYNKERRCVVRDVDKLLEIDYTQRLRNLCEKQNTRFVEYRPETGSWVFRVEHFSKYGLPDDNSDEHETKQDDKNKLKSNKTTEADTTLVHKQTSENSNKGLYTETTFNKSLDSSDTIKQLCLTATSMDPPKTTYTDTEFVDNSSTVSTISLSESTEPSSYKTGSTETIISYAALETESNLFQMMQEQEICPKFVSPKLSLMKSTFFGVAAEDISSINSYESSEIMRHNLYEEEISSNYNPVRTDKHISNGQEIMNSVELEYTGMEFSNTSVTSFMSGKTLQERTEFLLKISNFALTDSKYYEHSLSDMIAFKGRSFKVGWAKDMTFITNSLEEFYPDNRIDFSTNSLFMENSCVHTIKIRHNNKLNDIQEQLDCQLKNSKYTSVNECPYFEPENGFNLLKSYKNLMQNMSLNTKDNLVKYYCNIWNLCNALWCKIDEQDAHDFDTMTIRKKLVSDWLKEAVNSIVEANLNKASYEMFKILIYLSGNRLEDAAKTALATRNFRLSLIITQLPLTTNIKSLFIQTLHSWQSYNMNNELIHTDVLKLYMLFAGIIKLKFSEETINVCEQFNWLQAFGIYFWYINSPAQHISDVVKSYEEAFMKNNCAWPTVHYNNGLEVYDLMYHLFKFYCDSSYPMDVILNPVKHTADLLDYSLSWFLLETFTSLGLTTYSEELYQHICINFAAQLENMDLWHWSVYVLLFIKNTQERKYLVTCVLQKHVKLLVDSDRDYKEKEEMLVKNIHVPQKWIDSAKADLAFAQKSYSEAMYYFKYSDRLYEMHNILFDKIVPDHFISFDYDYLKNILLEIELTKHKIHNWEVTGQFVLNLIEIQEIFDAIQMLPKNENSHSTEIKYFERFKSLLMNISYQFANFPYHSYKHNICLNEMSSRVLKMIQVLFGIKFWRSSLFQNEDGTVSRSARDDLVSVLMDAVDNHISSLVRYSNED